MGKQNATNCTYNFSVGSNDTVTDWAVSLQGKAKISVTLETNGTYTIETCFKNQFKPKRKKSDGSYTEKEDMGNATKEYWKEKGGEKSGGDKPTDDKSGSDSSSGKKTKEREGLRWLGWQILEQGQD